ncbi:MAG TPA: DUF3325 domain-containing protein [Polyangiales bacterium]|nr:DUF3325 domain-containing protein [Polyangiales bacterium]
MADGLLRAAALLLCTCGMAWLALAMRPHWQQVRGAAPLSAAAVRRLRCSAAGAHLAAFATFSSADQLSMAVLVWVMALALSAACVAFTLAYRPGWLAWLAGSACVARDEA